MIDGFQSLDFSEESPLGEERRAPCSMRQATGLSRREPSLPSWAVGSDRSCCPFKGRSGEHLTAPSISRCLGKRPEL